MEETAQVLEVERRGATAWLWLNRPEVRNALDGALTAALGEALVALERDEGVRVLVLAGRGRAFCAGGDLARMEQAATLSRDEARRDAERFAKLLYRVHACPKPTIARVHGAAYAGGMGLVAACDLVVAAEEAEFCLPETRIGLVPAMISPYLVRALGAQQARRYVLTAERLSAREAHRLGFAHECVPQAELDARVETLAQRLAQAGPQALARAKKLLDKVERAALTPQLAADTATLLAEVRAGKEAREGMRAFLEKRTPRWTR
ncbi:MAG TPA: enoyl-CoA hydratase/isomerase family protein [Burkholderiales bacterium]|nr:enoyl-CoA hydratase/isomerase family protein [Burkholderiales bacterium]